MNIFVEVFKLGFDIIGGCKMSEFMLKGSIVLSKFCIVYLLLWLCSKIKDKF